MTHLFEIFRSKVLLNNLESQSTEEKDDKTILQKKIDKLLFIIAVSGILPFLLLFLFLIRL